MKTERQKQFRGLVKINSADLDKKEERNAALETLGASVVTVHTRKIIIKIITITTIFISSSSVVILIMHAHWIFFAYIYIYMHYVGYIM